MITYADLINKNGTIYTKSGKGYATPEELAIDLGINSTQIDWTKIAKEGAAPPVSAVAPAPELPSSFNPNINPYVPPMPAPAPAPKPAVKPVVQSVATITPAEKPYIRNPNGLDVYDRQGNYISAEKAAQIPGFWDQVEITATAPSTSKGQGLGGPVSGMNDGLAYISYNGTDVYEKATGRYIPFEEAKKSDIWNKIETSVDPKVLESLGIDPNGEAPKFKNEDLAKEYATTVSPYQKIYDDFKVELGKTNDKLEQAWMEYNMAVVEIEENPWLLTGEVTQELNKLKKTSLAKINALTSTKQALLDEFNLAVGIQTKEEEWQKAQKELTPQEQSAQDLADYEAKLQLEQKYATPKEPETTADITEYNFAKSQGYAGTFEQWAKAKATGGGGGTTGTPDLATTLYNVGLPQTAVTDKGKLTDGNLTKLGKVGLSPNMAQEIMDAIIGGASLEQIRTALATQYGKDQGFKYLDDFMQTLQGTTATGATSNEDLAD